MFTGQMMDFPLVLPVILRRAETFFASKAVVTRRPDRSLHRTNYGAIVARARKLAGGLRALGLGDGDRVATLAWNGAEHLEAYYGVSAGGMVLHTLNLRLHPDDLAYIASHAGDRACIVDESLLPLLLKFRERTPIEHVIVIRSTGTALPPGARDYEDVLALADASYDFPEIDERQAAGMCYTSGTTGKPKGVVYSHRSLCLHAMAAAMGAIHLDEPDTVLAIVPMFHANAWGLPFTCAMMGSQQVFPGQHMDPASLLELLAGEKVTLCGGVPTVLMGILKALDEAPSANDLSALRTVLCGGAAVPMSVLRGFEERHGLRVLHAWGMTETSPIGTLAALPSWRRHADKEAQFKYRARQGLPAAFVEIRARAEDGALIPWDGAAMGELEVRGPWVVKSYYDSPESADRFTADGWFRTGDVVSIDAEGCMEIRDRSKDVVKSGGEWISSVALENALMGHPDVVEATVIGVPHPTWTERPLAVVVRKAGSSVTHETLMESLAPHFATWWLPDATEFVEVIPKTSVGKFAKNVIRDQYRDRLGGLPS